MKKNTSLIVAPILAMTLVLSGCTTDSAAQDPFTQTVDWSSCDQELLLGNDETSDLFSASDAECALVTVPASYAKGAATETLTIQLMRDPANKPDQKIGTLFSNPGGPGQSGLKYIQFVDYPASIRDRFDIIGLDPRGVGASSPVRCDDELDLRSYFESHLDYQNKAQWQEDLAANDQYYQVCMENNPLWWAMTTENVVRDFELVRQLIAPQEKFNFIGHSYGTTVAETYIRLFPEHAGRIILDSPTTPDTPDYQDDIDQTAAFAEARNRIFDMCIKDPQCGASSRKEIEDRLIWARDQILADKMTGDVAEIVGDGFFQRGTGESAYLITRALTYLSYFPTEDAYPIFKDAYLELETGSYRIFELLGLEFDGYDWETLERDNSTDILVLVNCLDTDQRDLLSEEEAKIRDAAFDKADAFEARFTDIYSYEPPVEKNPGCFWSWEAFNDPKVDDPPSSAPAITNTSGKKFLVIGSKGDTATPYSLSVTVAQDLKSPLITYTGTGHAILFDASSCVDSLAINYLINGEAPTEDVVCGP